MKLDSRSWRGCILLQALLILAGCAATEPRPAAPPVLDLASCAAAAALDPADFDASHKTLESLVAEGKLARERLLSTQCTYGNTARRSDYLLAVGRQLKAELSDYLQQAEAWQQAYSRLDRELRDYYQRCLGEALDGSRYQVCVTENVGLDAARQQLDDQAAPLQQRNQELTAAVTEYRGALADAQQESAQARQDYIGATQGYGRWLAEAYALSASPAVQPYAAQDGCPVLAEPPQSPEAMLSLGNSLLDCFSKIMGPAAPPVPGGGG